MAQAVSRRPLTAEARFQARVAQCEICDGPCVTGIGFLQGVFSPVNIALWFFIPLYHLGGGRVNSMPIGGHS
jgi:hypothetical protein